MGLSYLTRYNLFMESGDSIESDDGIVRFEACKKRPSGDEAGSR